MTYATGFCNAISVLILRREPSPLPVAKPTGFTTVAPRCSVTSPKDAVDLTEVQGCRRAYNQLGFAYQVGRLLNRFAKNGFYRANRISVGSSRVHTCPSLRSGRASDAAS